LKFVKVTNDLKKSITALEPEMKYVQNCIEVGFREKASGEIVIKEISALIQKLKEKLKCTTN